ncbi:MAG: hypothetical protein ACE5GE_11865, partial [Phycisphaerae bacterium]
EYGLMVLSGGLAVLAIGLAYLLFVRWVWLPSLVADLAPGVFRVLHNKYYVDEGYDKVVVRPIRKGGRFCFGIDEYVVDGLVWLVTAIPRLLAYMLRSLQTGSLQGYGLTMAAGAAVLMLLVLLM